MPTFEIRYAGSQRGVSATFYYFDVSSGEAPTGVEVAVGESVGDLWENSGANRSETEWRVALGYLRRHLPNVVAQALRGVFLTAQEGLDVGDSWIVDKVPERSPYEWKECRYQGSSGTDMLCKAHHPEDGMKGMTTRAACRGCDLPSTDILCHNLVYPLTLPSGMDSLGLASRKVVDAQCDVRSREFDRQPGLCVPGGRRCWVQTYAPEEPALVPGGTGDKFSVGDAIDLVNMAFRKRYGRRLIQIEHARSIEDLMSECATDEALQLKLQVLAGLLEGIDLSALLTEEDAEGSQGSIDLLERLFKRDLPRLPEQHLRNLRSINRLANAYPRHPRVKNIERAHTELGLPYPLTDYAKAWAIARETFVQTLRQIALHLS
jgi:hypothetical protein